MSEQSTCGRCGATPADVRVTEGIALRVTGSTIEGQPFEAPTSILCRRCAAEELGGRFRAALARVRSAMPAGSEALLERHAYPALAQTFRPLVTHLGVPADVADFLARYAPSAEPLPGQRSGPSGDSPLGDSLEPLE